MEGFLHGRFGFDFSDPVHAAPANGAALSGTFKASGQAAKTFKRAIR